MAVEEEDPAWKPNLKYPQEGKVLVHGSEQHITITEKAVMFDGPDGIWGFDRSAIRAVKLVKGEYAWNIAYAVNGEVKSVKVEIVSWRSSMGTTYHSRYMVGLGNSLYEFVTHEDQLAASDLT